MPGLKTTDYTSGDFSWLLNTHALRDGMTGVLDVSTFTKATHFPDGYFPSGLPVNCADRDVIKPWTDAAGERLGFVIGDHKTDGVEDVNAAVLVHGAVKFQLVPLTGFAKPVTAPQPQFVLVEGV